MSGPIQGSVLRIVNVRSDSAADAQEKGGRVRIMFPMITTLEEIRKVRAMVRRACQQLQDEHKPCVEIPVGMMLEGLLDRTVVWFKRNGELSPSELGATLCRVFLEGAQQRPAHIRSENEDRAQACGL